MFSKMINILRGDGVKLYSTLLLIGKRSWNYGYRLYRCKSYGRNVWFTATESQISTTMSVSAVSDAKSDSTEIASEPVPSFAAERFEPPLMLDE